MARGSGSSCIQTSTSAQPRGVESVVVQKRPARCSSSGARVRGIFHFGTKVVCPGCGRTVGTRHFSALTHSAQLAAHNKSAQRKAI